MKQDQDWQSLILYIYECGLNHKRVDADYVNRFIQKALSSQRQRIVETVELLKEDVLGPNINKKWLKERGKGYYEALDDLLDFLNTEYKVKK